MDLSAIVVELNTIKTEMDEQEQTARRLKARLWKAIATSAKVLTDEDERLEAVSYLYWHFPTIPTHTLLSMFYPDIMFYPGKTYDHLHRI